MSEIVPVFCISRIRIWLFVVNSDWLVFLSTFVRFSLESNLQPLCHHASKHLGLSFENVGPFMLCN